MLELEIYTVKNQALCKINVDRDNTIKDVKRKIEEQKKLSVDRQSIRTDLRGRDQKDSLTISSLSLQSGGKLYVKDLGPQIGWKTVFLLEYFGPLVVYLFMATRPWIFYGDKGGNKYPYSDTAYIALMCWSFHYLKRLLETLFVHRFSHGTMPLRNLFKNCGYYWGFAAYVAYHTNHPLYTPPIQLQMIIGLVIFVVCELGNLSIHLLLRDLRPAGTTVRKIPVPNSNPLTLLFNYVSCPNYTYEYGAWVGFTIMTSCLAAGIFALAGMYQMTVWALGKHRNYKNEFKNYPKRKAIIPFIL